MDVLSRADKQRVVSNGIAELVYVVAHAVACHRDPSLPRTLEPIEALRAGVGDLVEALRAVESSDAGRAMIGEAKSLLAILDAPTAGASVVDDFVEHALAFFGPQVSRVQFEAAVDYMARLSAGGAPTPSS